MPYCVNGQGLHVTCGGGSVVSLGFSSTTCVTVETASTTPTSTEMFANGISFGDLVIAFFLFLMLTMQFFGGIMNRIVGVRIKKKVWNTTKVLKDGSDQKEDDDS